MNTVCIVALIILFLAVILLFFMLKNEKKKISSLENRYNRFLRGKDVENMEEIILKRFAEINVLKKNTKTVTESLSTIDELLQGSFQKTGIVKYDAFDDIGGNLSFALAMLTKKNNGFILNSVHGKEGCYTYLKEVVNGKSYIALGAEEQEALEKAVNADNFME